MDPTLLIALVAASLSVVLFGVMVVLLALLVGLMWRSRSRTAARAAPARPPAARSAPVQAAAPAAAPAQAAAPAEAPAPASPPKVDPTARTVEQPKRAAEPAGNMIGFFDDEASAPNLDLRSELFNTGAIPTHAFHSVPPQRMDDGSDGNDGEATEIFSASQLGAEFAEFLEDDEPSGRIG